MFKQVQHTNSPDNKSITLMSLKLYQGFMPSIEHAREQFQDVAKVGTLCKCASSSQYKVLRHQKLESMQLKQKQTRYQYKCNSLVGSRQPDCKFLIFPNSSPVPKQKVSVLKFPRSLQALYLNEILVVHVPQRESQERSRTPRNSLIKA